MRAPARQLIVAVVDDDPQVLDYFSARLAGERGIMLVTARRGGELLDLLRRHAVDCVVTGRETGIATHLRRNIADPPPVIEADLAAPAIPALLRAIGRAGQLRRRARRSSPASGRGRSPARH